MNALKRLKTHGPFAFVLLLAAALPASARVQQSYGYISVIEGSADVVQAGSRDDGEESTAEMNQPILAGDRLRLADRSRAEVVLADRNLLRVDGGSDVVFDRLANSPDTTDRRTVLQLLEGNVVLVVDADALSDDLPRVETSNATITIEAPGTFRITADREGWTQVVARRGSAKVDSEDGAIRVRAGDELVIEDGQRYRPETEEAGGFDSLERWAGTLDRQYADYDDDRYIEDESLRYAARPLSRYGTWISLEGTRYWRPRNLAVGWRPYWQGRWAYTPSGVTWVSYEPWGWVPYHYGSWDYIPTYGWVWQPGYSYAPAHVYWYWGSDYVGWCPTGYYTRYYGNRFDSGFRFGVYGWANAGWSNYERWNFVRPDHFGRRDQQRYAVPVDRYRNGGGAPTPGRGIITTDTRPLKPELWRKPQEAVRTLSGWQGLDTNGRAIGKGPRELPDVTGFIARKPQLSPTEVRTVSADRDAPSLDQMTVKPIGGGRSPVELGGGGGRWSQPGSQGGSSGPAERRAADNSTRPPQGSNKPLPTGGGTGNKPAKPVPGDAGDADGRWAKPAPKPTGGATPEVSWRSRRRAESPSPGETRPQPEAKPEPPAWRKPAAPERNEPSGDVPNRSWRNDKPSGESGSSGGGVRPKPRSDEEPSGGSPRSNERSRPTYERPAPPPLERSPEPPSRPVYKPREDSGSSGGGSSYSAPREREAQPKPRESSPRPEASPRDKDRGGSRGSSSGSEGNKGPAKQRKPPADSDGDGGRNRP